MVPEEFRHGLELVYRCYKTYHYIWTNLLKPIALTRVSYIMYRYDNKNVIASTLILARRRSDPCRIPGALVFP